MGGHRAARTPALRPPPGKPWRDLMHPDDRAWLDAVEAPLVAEGWEPPVPSFMDLHGDDWLQTELIR